MDSLNFCISSKAPSQFPVKISAAIFPQVAERERSVSVDYVKNQNVGENVCTEQDVYILKHGNDTNNQQLLHNHHSCIEIDQIHTKY